ncbi:MAG: peptide deformylase [Candidatus Sungbacteria bacterium]|uniref:Peptide deformylase n=1 Tax=Candidatus Sungiibacteriota bacterium TaxID=2750080 RepID=A0A9D6LU91_9BACT|nr:peptide deformylase [Candidatus Sungbacteria bacterium]
MSRSRTILTNPNPLLRKRAKEVSAAAFKTAALKHAIRDLIATLKVSEDGIGIAAPQIGIAWRIFIVSEEAKHLSQSRAKENREWKQLVYINPVITKFSTKKAEGVEGCLSVPGKYGFVTRPEKVQVEAFDEKGKKFSHGASKFFARVIQHETDHLDGILFIDKVTRYIEPKKSDSKL